VALPSKPANADRYSGKMGIFMNIESTLEDMLYEIHEQALDIHLQHSGTCLCIVLTHPKYVKAICGKKSDK
jgi:hypothetical protein